MSNASDPAGDPQNLLADTHALVHRVRQAQRTTWAALLVLGVTVLLAIPFYRFGNNVSVHCQTSSDGRVSACVAYPTLAAWYWPVALVVAYAIIGAIFIAHARSRGVASPVRPYVVVGIVLVAVAIVIAVWEFRHPLSGTGLGPVHLQPGSSPLRWLRRLVGPLGAIGFGLLVLAWVERTRALAVFAVLYLIVVVVTTPTGLHQGPVARWVFLPGILVPGLALLVGSAVFALLERPPTPGAPRE